MNEDEKNTVDQATGSSSEPQAPADALSRTPDELEEEQATQAANNSASSGELAPKKPSSFKKILRKANIYFLLFLLIVIIGAAITVINYLNSQEEPEQPNIVSQELTEEQLRQLGSTDTSVGDASQTLTIRGSAVIDGQTLMRGNLNVAGNLQTGGSIQGPSLMISGSSNLGEVQINSLQVANNVSIQGDTTMRNINIAGASSFSGPMTASQITVSRLVMSGNASLEVPNHIGFTGPTPNRTINSPQLGSGGSASVSGSDTTGTVNIATGNGPVAGCMVRINFNQRFSNQPHVLVSPIGNAAGRTDYYVDRDQAGFSICAASPAPANQSFAFDYFVTN